MEHAPREYVPDKAEDEMIDQIDEQGRWTPVAFNLAMLASLKKADGSPSQEGSSMSAEVGNGARTEDSYEYDESSGENHWTPVALKLAMTNGD